MQLPRNTGHGQTTHPDICANLFDRYPPGPAHGGTLADHIARRSQALADQPLRQSGIQAAGHRVFGHALTGNKSAHLKLCFITVPLQAPGSHNTNGPGWVALLLGDREQVLALKPDYAQLSGLAIGVVAPWSLERDGDEAQFEVRAFIAGEGMPEDPVTGSLNAGLAQWLIGEGLAPLRYVASQGTAMRRVRARK